MTDIFEPAVVDGDADPKGLMEELRSLGTFGQMWTFSVVILCAARAVIVWPMLNEYGINAWWFLVLDVGTAPFYGVGQAMGVKLLRDETRPMRDAAPWVGMVLFSFLAPYLYVLRSAGHLPSYVIAGVLAWMAVFGSLGAWRMAREVRMEPVAG